MAISSALESLLRKYIGRSANFNPHDDLELMLGITGDDAVELLTEYSERFKVDVSEFMFDDYFYGEGSHMFLVLAKLFRTYSKKELSVHDLQLAIEKGKLL